MRKANATFAGRNFKCFTHIGSLFHHPHAKQVCDGGTLATVGGFVPREGDSRLCLLRLRQHNVGRRGSQKHLVGRNLQCIVFLFFVAACHPQQQA